MRMGRLFLQHLEGNSLCCKSCKTHLALHDDLLSKQFHSKNGPAWLFESVVNVVHGPPEERLMTTGMHIVSDISCTRCMSLLGWKYVAAHEENQKYKEGKFILERANVSETKHRASIDSGLIEYSDDIDAHYY
eukprot:GHUV01004391.1.p1 GENE.GHUV01004391.1~~GHUV01004391.1.p1  ORF type:complete len:133 (+),score=24.76 GHUV01004391.1:106-504(+)